MLWRQRSSVASIYLIRHGQASFGKADYDQLSEKGSMQAHLLGKSWQSQPAPEIVFSGNLLRHEQTLESFLTSYQGKKPDKVIHSGFNEFNHLELLTRYDSKWQDFPEMTKKIAQKPAANKCIQREFSLALKRWVSGQYDDEYIESWPQFKKRCVAALQTVSQQVLSAKNRLNNAKPVQEICIFTSGGTISVLVQHILGLSDQNTLAIIQQLRNTSVTKLIISETNLSIDYLNNYSHLSQAGADWITFR